MELNVIDWIAAVTALANMVTAVTAAIRSGGDARAAGQAADKALNGGEFTVGQSEQTAAENIIIDKELLGVLVEDIENARTRFVVAIRSASPSNIDDIDREEREAREAICRHVERIRQYNGGRLPGSELEQIALSFRCVAPDATA